MHDSRQVTALVIGGTGLLLQSALELLSEHAAKTHLFRHPNADIK